MTAQLLFNLFHVVLVNLVDVLLEWVDNVVLSLFNWLLEASIATTALNVSIKVMSSTTALV